MNYYIHRISHHAELSYPLLDRGYLSIGFSDFSNKEFLNQTLKGNRTYFDNQFTEYWGHLPQSRKKLWQFLYFKKNDLIIIPEKCSISICEVIDGGPELIQEVDTTNLHSWNRDPISTNNHLLCNSYGALFDLGFFRKVKIIYKSIPKGKKF